MFGLGTTEFNQVFFTFLNRKWPFLQRIYTFAVHKSVPESQDSDLMVFTVQLTLTLSLRAGLLIVAV